MVAYHLASNEVSATSHVYRFQMEDFGVYPVKWTLNCKAPKVICRKELAESHIKGILFGNLIYFQDAAYHQSRLPDSAL